MRQEDRAYPLAHVVAVEGDPARGHCVIEVICPYCPSGRGGRPVLHRHGGLGVEDLRVGAGIRVPHCPPGSPGSARDDGPLTFYAIAPYHGPLRPGVSTDLRDDTPAVWTVEGEKVFTDHPAYRGAGGEPGLVASRADTDPGTWALILDLIESSCSRVKCVPGERHRADEEADS